LASRLIALEVLPLAPARPGDERVPARALRLVRSDDVIPVSPYDRIRALAGADLAIQLATLHPRCQPPPFVERLERWQPRLRYAG
jgi:hypothetical protein